MGLARMKDSLLAGQAANFGAVLASSPETYNQSAAVAAAVSAAVDAFVESYNALTEARANGVRSEAMTATKDANRLAMLDRMRPIYASVQESAGISDADKIALGVRVKSSRPSARPAPDFAPLLSVAKVDGSVVTLSVRDPNALDRNRGRRPAFTAGISLFSYVGDEPPTHVSQFKFEAITGRNAIDVTFPPGVASGATVWFSAFYFNNRKQSGPACAAVRATIGAGSTMRMAA